MPTDFLTLAAKYIPPVSRRSARKQSKWRRPSVRTPLPSVFPLSLMKPSSSSRKPLLLTFFPPSDPQKSPEGPARDPAQQRQRPGHPLHPPGGFHRPGRQDGREQQRRQQRRRGQAPDQVPRDHPDPALAEPSHSGPPPRQRLGQRRQVRQMPDLPCRPPDPQPFPPGRQDGECWQVSVYLQQPQGWRRRWW